MVHEAVIVSGVRRPVIGSSKQKKERNVQQQKKEQRSVGVRKSKQASTLKAGA